MTVWPRDLIAGDGIEFEITPAGLLIKTASSAGDDVLKDPIGRQRIVSPVTVMDAKQIGTNNPLVWDRENSTGGSQTYSANDSVTSMAVTASSGEYAIAQTKQRALYQAGKSLLWEITIANFAPQAGAVKRVGCFDSNTVAPFDSNRDGIYLESDGSAVFACLFKNGVQRERTTQASFNLDTLDGNGPSGVNINWNNSQILLIDFLWLGVGPIRFGIQGPNNLPIWFHLIDNPNVISSTYMRSPIKPARYELRSTGGEGALSHICASSSIEGTGIDKVGLPLTVLNSAYQIGSGTIGPLIAIRLQSSRLDSIAFPEKLSLHALSSGDFRYLLYLNPSLTIGGTPTAWESLTFTGVGNSGIEAFTAFNNTYIVGTGNGIILDAGEISQDVDSGIESTRPTLPIGAQINGDRDVLVLAASPGTNETFQASLTWRELL